jgi:hypothetical protein
MKNVLLLLFCGIAFNLSAFDVIELTNGKTFKGEIVKVNKCSIDFAMEDNVFSIPASDIVYAEFAKISKRRVSKINRVLSNGDNCLAGTSDGSMHGHKGGHFCAGFFGGLIGFVIVAVVDRTPSKSGNVVIAADNKSLWSDSSYLMCYEKASKKEAMKMAGIGWGSFLILYIVALAGA